MLCAWDWDLSNEHLDYRDMSWRCLEYSWSKSRDKTCSEESARSGISWVFWKGSCGLILLVESLKLWFFAVWTFSRWVRGSFWSPPTWQRWPVESEPTSLVCTLQLSSMWWVLCCLVIEAKTSISCCAPHSSWGHDFISQVHPLHDVPCFLCWINLTHMSHISSISWWNLILNHFRMIPGVPKFVAVQTWWLTKLFLPCSPHFPSGLVESVLSSPGAAHGKMCHAQTGGFETPSRPRHLAD